MAGLWKIPEPAAPERQGPGLSACEELARMGAVSPKDGETIHEAKVEAPGPIVNVPRLRPRAEPGRTRLERQA